MMILVLILACGGSDGKPDASADGDTGDGGVDYDLSGWSGGNFDFQTTDVKDNCLEGAFEALFMPEGPSVPHDFEYEIYIPDFADLPENYTIDLRDPFVEMPVSVDSADDRTYEISGSVMDSVELGRGSYGDCVVTMTVDVELTPVSADSAEGSATIEISDPRGDDGLCPVFEMSPCTVNLDITASRS